MTILDHRGAPDTARFTNFMRYPLPPFRNREGIELVRGRYMLPSPTTGKLTAYSRATKIAGTVSDDGFLGDWKIREQVFAILRAKEIRDTLFSGGDTAADGYTDNELAMGASYSQFEVAVSSGTNRDVNSVLELIHDLSGGADARELGSAVHDWLAELDMGNVLVHQLPDFMQPYAAAYQKCLAEAGLVAVPEYVERVIFNDRGRESIAGRIDRIYRCVDTGKLFLGDLKTSKSSSMDLNGVLLEYAVQFSVYGYATRMLSIDGEQRWEDMPAVDQETCVVLHVPRDEPERASVVPFDMWAGGEALITAMEVRAHRREVPKKVRAHSLRVPSEESVRLVEARHALLNIKDRTDASSVFEKYEDVWTDELTQLGASCIELLTATTNEEN